MYVTVVSSVRHGLTGTVPRYGLRESDTRFSPSGFFYESLSPGPLSIPLGPFRFFSLKNSRRYSQINVYCN
jgi:hypothetical protein